MRYDNMIRICIKSGNYQYGAHSSHDRLPLHITIMLWLRLGEFRSSEPHAVKLDNWTNWRGTLIEETLMRGQFKAGRLYYGEAMLTIGFPNEGSHVMVWGFPEWPTNTPPSLKDLSMEGYGWWQGVEAGNRWLCDDKDIRGIRHLHNFELSTFPW